MGSTVARSSEKFTIVPLLPALLFLSITVTVLACGCGRVEHSGDTAETSRSHLAPDSSASVPHSFAATSDGVIVPHAGCPISDSNMIWCATFQLAWNQLCNMAGGEVQTDPTCPLVDAMNQCREKGDVDLNEESCLVMVAEGQDAVGRIGRAYRQHFGRKDAHQVLPAFEDGQAIGVFAALSKSLEFAYAFRSDKRGLSFGGQQVKAFGVSPTERSQDGAAGQVIVIDYVAPTNFIIELSTADPADRLIVARITPFATLDETIAHVQERMGKAKRSAMAPGDVFFMPVVRLESRAFFPDLYMKRIVAPGTSLHRMQIAFAAQKIDLMLDERGAKVDSAASIFLIGHPPRSFVVNGPFLLLLQRSTSQNPYFAAWVCNADLMEPLLSQQQSGAR